ncbi:hypothetical protein TNCV_4077451 [Trichonephila clavipes]|uniref:Uncharacterized protein n=1 Tax=Trichonephila clavipes TaxID=2585209 RepID=A0A8X6R2F7_TRICX|nr:hypothetical protein TNCV_4077451 [Trichonephila clavipes]
MALEYPQDRLSPFSFGRFGEYSQLPNLGNRQSAFHLTSSATLPKRFELLQATVRVLIIRMKETGSANWRIARHIGRRMRPLEDTSKNVWTMADFSVMMVAIDRGPWQIG